MISYDYQEGRETHRIPVKLDGKKVGDIRMVDNGWQYFPKGQTTGGEIYPTLVLCQKSLESPKPDLLAQIFEQVTGVSYERAIAVAASDDPEDERKLLQEVALRIHAENS